MNVLRRPNEAIKASLRRLKPLGRNRRPKTSLVFQRLFWGALAGCLMAVFFGDSPLLESMEQNMLEWRYKTADQLMAKVHPGPTPISKDIAIVAFDDSSQFDFSAPRFSEDEAQAKLAQVLETIEQGSPTLVAIDLDLRGAANPNLINLIRRYDNVVLSVFGSLEGSSDLPNVALLRDAVGYGYDELSRESNGEVLRLPVNAPSQMGSETTGVAQVPSLTEAIMGAYRLKKGLSPNDSLQTLTPDQPAYINFKRLDYPVYSMSRLIDSKFDSSKFKDKIVLIAPTLTSKRQDPSKVVTPLRGRTSAVYAHADALTTMLNNEMIFSFPRGIAHHILILLGAMFGAFCSMLPLGRRTIFAACVGVMIVLIAQVGLMAQHIALPVVAPLAMLAAGFIMGTVIFLDTDLRLRNRELAVARESMQVRAEEERKRIAGDLHDETLPALSSVARMIDELFVVDDYHKSSVPERMRKKLDDAIQEMRRVINDLHPSVLETMGFVPALENLAVMLSRDCNIEYDFIDRNGQDDYEISDFAKLQLYRIVQEALNNVGKHSKASKVEVKLQTLDNWLEISVVDNGNGINPKLIRRDSHGLLNIKHRAQLIGAIVEWRKPQAFTSGTEMRVSVPLVAVEAKQNGDNRQNSTSVEQTAKKGSE